MNDIPLLHGRQACLNQQGSYAVEFALVFSLFFMVFYAVLTYGLIFAAQQSLNLAVENGARKALGWQPTRDARAFEAKKEASRVASWLNTLGGEDALKIDTCYSLPASAQGAAQEAASACTTQHINQFKIVALYPYRSAPLVPFLGPGFLRSLAVPEYLRAEASVNLGIASEMTPQGAH